MIEKTYQFTLTAEDRLVEKIVADAGCIINHMILPKGSEVPSHMANGNVYLLIINGTMQLYLGEQEAHAYPAGSIVNFPAGTMMSIRNEDEEQLSFIIVKI